MVRRRISQETLIGSETMKETRFAAVGLILLSFPTVALTAQSAAGWTQALAAYMAPYVQMNDFSGTILMVREGHDSVVVGFGFADRARGVRNTPATRYGIGSLTKTFTAAAIAMLRERGALLFDDTLASSFLGSPMAVRSPSAICWPTRRAYPTTTRCPSTPRGGAARSPCNSSPRGSGPSRSISDRGRRTRTRAPGTRCLPM